MSELERLNVLAVPELQAIEVKLPQVPENNSITVPEVLRLLPMLLNEIVVLACTAVKLYQTSSSAEPPHEGVATPEFVLATIVPAVTAQDVFDVSEVADAQLSFEGDGIVVTQTVNVPALDPLPLLNILKK